MQNMKGQDLSIVATPDDGYYFYAWKNVTVTGVDSSNNDIWVRHSSRVLLIMKFKLGKK